MKLRNVYEQGGEPGEAAIAMLYKLLAERPHEANISHDGKLPTLEQHRDFVRSRPYREWFVVLTDENVEVGAIYATLLNEIGISILKEHQERGYAKRAVRALLQALTPLPAIPAQRRGSWIANVSPKNWRSKALFEGLDSRVVQLTYEIPRGGNDGDRSN